MTRICIAHCFKAFGNPFALVRFRLAGVLLFAGGLCDAQTAPPIRLAIVSEESGLTSAADLLTAQLSKDGRLALLEREQISKALNEQALALASGEKRDYLKIGQLLGADGLLIIHLSQEGDLPLLNLRLVGVKTGITFDQHEYPWPLDDPEQWSALVAAQFQSWLPKLAVLPQDAVPISILNLRSALASAKSEALERELTSLLYNRLVKERDVFVLERRRMELLTEEKELNNATEGSFWNGSFLLEGVIDKQGFNPDKLSLDIQLAPRNTKEIAALAVTGSRTNLPAVIDALARRILAAVKLQGGAAKWEPQAEADRYFAEAKWTFKWHIFQEAKAASEAAWALGNKSREVADLRIRAYQESAGDPGICVIQNDSHIVVFGEQLNPRVHNPTQAAAFAKVPPPERFADMVGALALYPDALRQFVAPEQKPDPAWLNMGIQLLDRASMWLRYHYFTAEARSGQEERIEAAKKLCREIAGTLSGNPAFAKADTNNALVTLQAEHSAFWMDTPEEGLQIYRQLLEAGQWPLVRQRFFDGEEIQIIRQGRASWSSRVGASDGMGDSFDGAPRQGHLANLANPCLAGWKWEDRKRWPAVWNGFIDELCRSAKPLIQLEGRILQCSYSWSEEDFENNLKRLLAFVQEHEETLVGPGLAPTLLNDLRALVARCDSFTDTRRARIKDDLWPAFERPYKEFLKHHERALWNLKDQQKRLAIQEERRDYLNTHTQFDFSSFIKAFPGIPDYIPAEANELLPLVTNYAARIKSNNAAPTTNQLARMQRDGDQFQADYWIGQLKKQLNAVISIPPPQTNLVASIAGAPPPPPAAMVKPVGPPAPQRVKPPSATPAVKPLLASRFWPIPVPEDLARPETVYNMVPSPFQDRPSLRQIASARYRDGKLWVDVRYDQFGISGLADFYAIDLNTFTAGKISFRDEKISQANLPSDDHPGAFEVHGGYLYLLLQSYVTRYSLKDRSWNQFQVPATGNLSAARLGDRLFFTTENSILEYNADGSFKVLASSRRQPAASLLDAVEDFGSPHLFLRAGNTLHACVGNDVYAFSGATNDWSHIGTVPNMKASIYCAAADGFMTSGGTSGGACWGMFGQLSCPEPLFRARVRRSPMIDNRFIPQLAKRPATRWPDNAPSTDLCTDGDRIWFLVDPSQSVFANFRNGQVPPETDPRLSLVCFIIGEEQPIKMPLELAADHSTTLGGQTNRPFNPRQRQWMFQSTPQGLVATRGGVPGFWLIPKADLDQAVQSNALQRHLEQDALKARHEKWRQELLATYDRNHNGVFDPEEKEAMLNDPHFLELSLPEIDTNHNGLLDIEELSFFDANTNGVLDPQEQTAIDKTLSLLADKLMAKLDQDEEGKIDSAELPAELIRPSPFRQMPGQRSMPRFGPNPAERIGHDEVVVLMQSCLTSRLRGQPGMPQIPMIRTPQHLNLEPSFKWLVETYWRSSKSLNSTQAAPAKP